MKSGFYWRYVTRATWRGGQRTLLAMLCVAVGVMAIVALQLVGNMVNVSLTGDIRALNGGDLAVNGVNLTPTQLRYFDQLQAQGAITAYAAVATDNGAAQSPQPVARFDIDIVDRAHFPLTGTPTFVAPSQGQLRTILNSTTVVLTQNLARSMGAQVGDHFVVTLADGHAATITVGGIIANGGLFQQPLLVMDTTARVTFGESSAQPLLYTTVYADVPWHSANRITTAQGQIQGQFADADIVTASDLLDSNQQEVAGIQSFLRIIGLVALLIGGMGIVNSMQVLLRRRKAEIAMLKASGYKQRDLFILFGLEAGLLGLTGGVVGAAIGVGVSLIIKDYVAQAFALVLPTLIDPGIVAAGVVVGIVTALIFGILPIVQASQVRPIAILRAMPEGAHALSRASVALLGIVIAGLFLLLAVSILRDVTLALELIGGVAIVWGLLNLLFALIISILSRLPVPSTLPGRTTIKLALRNLGRQRGSTVTTQIAIFVGVFAVGVILVLGQGLQARYAQGGTGVNAIIWTPNVSAVRQRLQQSSAVTRIDVYRETSFAAESINGNDITAAIANHQFDQDNLLPLNGMLGFDLTHGNVPTAPDFALASGRMLTARDVGAQNVVADATLQQAPLNLKLGDQITVQYLSKNTLRSGGTASGNSNITYTIVGFYTNHTGVPSLESTLLADYGTVDTLGGNNALYEFGIHINPQHADVVLTQLQAALPGQVFVHSYVNLDTQVQTYLNNLMLVLELIVLPALLAAVINIANAVALAMLDRRREVGILKAVGYTSRSVLADVILEQCIAALTASGIAMLGAVGLALLLNIGLDAKSASVVTDGKGGSIGEGVSVSTPAIAIPLSLVIAIIIAGAVLSMIVTAVVAWNAAHRRPLAVLRYE